MRSSKKKGPRTRAVKLMHAAHPGSLDSRVKAALSAAAVSTAINAMWLNALADPSFREPPEAEPVTQNTPNKPPPIPGGAEACMENLMSIISPDELQRQRHEIARMAADAAGRVASHIPYEKNSLSPLRDGSTAASAGKAVADAYLSALAQLSAGSARDPAPSEAPV